TQISQTAEDCQKCRVEKTPPTARKRGLDAEKPFDQRRDRRQSDRQVQEDRQSEQQEDAEKQMILARPELGLFERLLEDWLRFRALLRGERRHALVERIRPAERQH